MPFGPRATAVVIKQGKVLLVRERGRCQYSLPGGGIHRGEPSISAAARELYEEVGLSTHKIERVGTHQSRTRRHFVYVVTDFRGRPRLKSEICALVWWDGKSSMAMPNHVNEILKLVHERFPHLW